ncbi:MAG: ergothioneine biosynthesis protein EgtB [Verrucomicrobia bacterium]|nr:MAG: ergothioneine biosynthesis protein EgtB [Verrucomicrobiota bacterium]PYL70887.1 MAG: ergothioneine biosynthesis protein EgtB [Verrucomicrobiota bacterium]
METASATAAAEQSLFPATQSQIERLRDRFHQVRKFTDALCVGLEPEDCVVQSMPDVSPAKWHLAHTTWFFETFILKKFVPGYRAEIPEYAYLFNSYYNAAGDMHRRDLRGLISRPTVSEAQRYRESIDSHMDDLLSNADEKLLDEIEPLLVLGVHHEQQHQELLITDIKHVFAQNPLYPVFRQRNGDVAAKKITPIRFIDSEETVTAIGHDGNGFAYDNEGPRHQALVHAFSLATRPVTNGEFIAFIEDNGYRRPEFWLSLGWMTVNEQRWNAPLYWTKRDGAWWNFTLSGLRRVDQSEPVTHVSYFEADAYANWAGARLPTEFEWERATLSCPIEGNFVETELFHPAPVAVAPNAFGAVSAERPEQYRDLVQMFGDVWEWTRSAYSPYSGYRAEPGALGEYNGKFMCNQYVLRGGSCATSRTHIRRTYRNFFQPEKRWQFTGIRLARDAQ